MGITAEVKEKHQLNGKVHHYTYYRCTRKSKTQKCTAKPVRTEMLDAQLSKLVAEYTMSQAWVSPLSIMLDKEAAEATITASSIIQPLHKRVAEISDTLARLTDVYVAQDIEREDYLQRRHALLSEKKSVEEQIERISRNPSAWIEPTRNWIQEASVLDEIAKTKNNPSKKLSLQKIFGLNLRLTDRSSVRNCARTLGGIAGCPCAF